MKTSTLIIGSALGLGALFLLGNKTAATPATPPPAPPPNADPAVTDLLRRQVDALLTQAAGAPSSVNPDMMEQLAVSLDAAGLNADAARVRAAEALVRQQRQPAMPVPPITTPPIMAPPTAQGGTPGLMSHAMAAEVRQALANPLTPIATLASLAQQIDQLQPGGGAFPDVVRQLRQRAGLV